MNSWLKGGSLRSLSQVTWPVLPEGPGDGGELAGGSQALHHQVGHLEARFLGSVDSSAVFVNESSGALPGIVTPTQG